MTRDPPDVEPVSPGSAEAGLVLGAYFRDIVSRYHGREATQCEVEAAMTAEPSEDLCPPHGLFFVARHGGAVIGCAGLRLLAAGTGEVTRVFVMPEARRRGVGQLLLEAVEAEARKQRVTALRLDTGSHLTEAQQLYARNGYREVPPFNDSRISDRWYEKCLGLTVLEVPQWQGSSSATAQRLVAGARALADLLPASRHVRPPVDVRPGAAGVVDEVRSLDVLTANLQAVRAALDQVDEPVIVTAGGDCGVELAPVERACRRHGGQLAVVWLDAHGDLNTPASSPSGAFHGMVLRTLLGDGPAALSSAWPLVPGQVVLAGVRALDPAERRFVDDHQIRHLSVAELEQPSALAEAVAMTGASAVYVHIDLDVLDPQVFGSVGFPEPGGLAAHQLAAAIRALAARFVLAGVGITEHQPTEAELTEAGDAAVLRLLASTLTDIIG